MEESAARGRSRLPSRSRASSSPVRGTKEGIDCSVDGRRRLNARPIRRYVSRLRRSQHVRQQPQRIENHGTHAVIEVSRSKLIRPVPLSHHDVAVRNSETHGVDIDEVVRFPLRLAVPVGGASSVRWRLRSTASIGRGVGAVPIGLEEFQSQRSPGQRLEQHVEQLNDELSARMTSRILPRRHLGSTSNRFACSASSSARCSATRRPA